MGKKKIKIEQLQNTKTRQLTYSKRKKGLIKKAMELSILCNANVYLYISSPEIPNDKALFSSTDYKTMMKVINEDKIEGNISNKNKVYYLKENYDSMFTNSKSINNNNSIKIKHKVEKTHEQRKEKSQGEERKRMIIYGREVRENFDSLSSTFSENTEF